MTKDREEQSKKLGSVIKKAWDDEAFMARLLEDATTVLSEEGIQIPDGLQVKAVQHAEKLTYLLVPPKPSSAIRDTELATISGGESVSSDKSYEWHSVIDFCNVFWQDSKWWCEAKVASQADDVAGRKAETEHSVADA